MRVLSLRRGFQADHSSSSYLFYAADGRVSSAGQRAAHRFSSRAEVDERTARYEKWGEAELSGEAYRVLLGEHYDVMVSESYDWWTLMIAVPKTADLERRLAPFREAYGYDDQGVDVQDFGAWLAVSVHCTFDYTGPAFDPGTEDQAEYLAVRLVAIRREIMAGNVSFLRAVADFYDAELPEPDDAPPLPEDRPDWQQASLRKADLQEACRRRGVPFRPSWTKEQLRRALADAASAGVPAGELSADAREIVATLQKV